jgi:hypothetical protein
LTLKHFQSSKFKKLWKLHVRSPFIIYKKVNRLGTFYTESCLESYQNVNSVCWCFFLSFLVILGGWTQGPGLMRLIFYHLSHVPSPFCFLVTFENRVLL